MCCTHAVFKLALRHCRASAEQLSAGIRAADVLEQDSRTFLNGVASDKARDAVGEIDICEMWKKHFSDLYNCISDDSSKSHFYAKCSSIGNITNQYISVDEVLPAVKMQKKGKSAEPNSLYMESFIYAGIKLLIHLSLLHTLFVCHCYLPSSSQVFLMRL